MDKLQSARRHAQARANREAMSMVIWFYRAEEDEVGMDYHVSSVTDVTAEIEVIEVVTPMFCHRAMARSFNRVHGSKVRAINDSDKVQEICPVDIHAEKGL